MTIRSDISPLATYVNLSSHCNSPRNHVIDTITIHCVVGQCTAKSGVDYFATTDRLVSSNYVIGYDGSIGCSVVEGDRSWCSSSSMNDNRAITIECASETKHPYKVTRECYASLIKLLVDICKRNNIHKLLWKNDKKLVGQVDLQNMTVHRWFANKDCPGQYLLDRMGKIAEEVNKLLLDDDVEPQEKPQHLYRVRKSWEDSKSQKGAYKFLENAIKVLQPGYHIYDENGNDVCPHGSHDDENNEEYIESLAWDVIRGLYGSGVERIKRLGDRYLEVQEKVNELLRR